MRLTLEKHGWLIGYLAFIPLFLVPGVYLVGHYILKIENERLLLPATAYSVVHVLLFPLWDWGLKRLRERQDERRELPVYQVATVYSTFFCLLCFFFVHHFGRISGTKAMECALLVLIVLPAMMTLMYRLRTKLFVRPL